MKFQKIGGSHSNLIFPHLFLPVNSNIYSDNTDKANVLDDYFTHKSTLCDINSILPAGFRFFNSISVSANDLESVLKSLQSDKASGPNVINNIILKKLIKPFSFPLRGLYNASLINEQVPAWALIYVNTPR